MIAGRFELLDPLPQTHRTSCRFRLALLHIIGSYFVKGGVTPTETIGDFAVIGLLALVNKGSKRSTILSKAQMGLVRSQT
jgi:hypothetical protein